VSEALFPDGSTVGNGLIAPAPGHRHEDGLSIAMHRARLIMARQALEVYLKHDGRMQLTRNGHKAAIWNVIEPLSGKSFTTPTGKVTKGGCRKALAECERMLAEIDATAIVYTPDEAALQGREEDA
jgi:hypothetical protein